MYSATLNGTTFLNTNYDSELYAIESASLSLEAGKSGDFTFNVPITNLAYDDFEKLTSYIDVYRDDELVFSGRVYSIEEAFDTMRTISCEGLLSILNDSIIRPMTFNDTLSALITELITQHNAQVGNDKQITIGSITVSDDYLFRQYDDYASTMNRIQDLVDSYGGYISITKQNGVLTFDWLDEFTTQATQSIDFGQNLLDVTQTTDSADLITVLIPLGAEIEEEDGTRRRLTIANIQEQQGNDYIENAEGIAEFGRIVGTAIWDDVTVDTNLLQKGTAYLNANSKSKYQISVNAVDLAPLNTSVDAFELGTVIRVNSPINGISDEFVCLAQSFDLMDPAQDVLTLGTTKLGYINNQARSINKLTETQNTIISNYATNTDVTSVGNRVDELNVAVVQNTSAIEQNSTDITLRATTEDLNALQTQLAELQLTSDNISIYFGENGLLSTWFTFDANQLTIGKADSEYHTEQDNDSYSIVNSAGDVLFTVTPEGTKQETAEVEKQVKFSYGGAGQWAIREAAYISGVGVNLNDVWIGG